MADGLVRYWEGEKNVNPWQAVPSVQWAITPQNVKSYVADGGEFPRSYEQLFESAWRI